MGLVFKLGTIFIFDCFLLLTKINNYYQINALYLGHWSPGNGTAIGVVCVTGAANRPDVPFFGRDLSR